MNDFKEKINDLIINYQEEEIMYENLAIIYNWPELSYYDEDTDTTNYEILSTNDCAIIDLTDEYMEVICGGGAQSPHLVRVELLEGELAITAYDPHEFLSGMDYEEIVEELKM